jgi:hypothetical protein
MDSELTDYSDTTEPSRAEPSAGKARHGTARHGTARHGTARDAFSALNPFGAYTTQRRCTRAVACTLTTDPIRTYGRTQWLT